MGRLCHPREADALFTFTVLTTFSNEVSATVHDRIPVIVQPKDNARWLDPETEEITDLLAPYPAAGMIISAGGSTARRTTTQGSSSRRDDDAPRRSGCVATVVLLVRSNYGSSSASRRTATFKESFAGSPLLAMFWRHSSRFDSVRQLTALLRHTGGSRHESKIFTDVTSGEAFPPISSGSEVQG
jgi:hypothetical protein